MEQQEIIEKLISTLSVNKYSEAEMQEMKGQSLPNDLFREFFGIFLPVGDLNIEEVDKITGFSKSFMEHYNNKIRRSPLPEKAIENLLKELEALRTRGSYDSVDQAIDDFVFHTSKVKNKDPRIRNGHILTKYYYAGISYESIVNGERIKLDLIFDGQISSKEGLQNFIEGVLIGNAIAHYEAILKDRRKSPDKKNRKLSNEYLFEQKRESIVSIR